MERGSTGRGIARRACALGLALAMALGGMPGGAVTAWASEAGTITVVPAQGNEGVTYAAYQLFKGTVGDSGTKLSGVTWGDGAQTAVEEAIAAYAALEGHDSYSGSTAQDAADYLAATLAGSTSDTMVGPGSLAAQIAKKLLDKEVSASATFGANTASQQLGSGYYLVVTQDSSLKGKTGVAATAVICTIAGSDGVTINEKASVPTLTKEVQEDSTGKYGSTADAQVGQEVKYRLTATLPTNYESYGSYHLQFMDYLSTGLEYGNDAKMLVVHKGQEVSEGVEIPASDNVSFGEDSTDKPAGTSKTLVFNVKDVKGVTLGDNVSVAASDTIVVEYTAKLNGNAAVGSAGNPNKARLIYSNDPNSTGEGKTELESPNLFTYQLKLTKKDKDKANTEAGGLSGAKFTIQLTDDGEDTSKGKYVNANGQLVEEQKDAILTTDAKGEITLKGLDSGTYQIIETKAPDGYLTNSTPAKFTVSSNRGPNGTLEVKASSSGNADITVTDATKTSAGEIDVVMTDVKSIGMPQTGSTGFVGMVAGGGCLVAASVVGLTKRRK